MRRADVGVAQRIPDLCLRRGFHGFEFLTQFIRNETLILPNDVPWLYKSQTITSALAFHTHQRPLALLIIFIYS